MATLPELLSRLREDLDDVVAPYLWSDALLLSYINQSQEQVCVRKDVLFEDSDQDMCKITLIADQRAYDLSQKWIQIDNIVYDNAVIPMTSESQLDKKHSRWRELTGKPALFWAKGFKLFLYPTPSADYADTDLSLQGWRLPLVTFDTDSLEEDPPLSPEILAEYHYDMLYYAKFLAFSRRDCDGYNPNKAAESLQFFERIFGKPRMINSRLFKMNSPTNTPMITGYRQCATRRRW